MKPLQLMSAYSAQYFLYVFLLLDRWCGAAVTDLTPSNIDTILGGSDVVFVNFYADWCRFSQMLTPIFEEASNKFTDPKKVVFARVDCDRQPDIAQKYHVSKYPTLKLWRAGQEAKREYRGGRSAEALTQFMEQQLIPVYNEYGSNEELEGGVEEKKRTIIAYFTKKEGPEWHNFVKVATALRDDCKFMVGSGDPFKEHLIGGNNIAFRPSKGTAADDQVFSGSLHEEELLRQWVTEKCIPLVREITFENAEELTEEGLPFLILFRDPADDAILTKFTEQVAAQLGDQRTAMNFLHADGKKFAHPLHHMGKTAHDLPVIAIDSFRHMFLFENSKELEQPGKLRQFVLDLHSGKLHREFHQGPDPTQPQPPAIGPDGQAIPTESQHKTLPPESTFRKLKPSESRYTLLKDEL